MLNPTHDGRVRQGESTFGHHLHEITKAEFVAQIPAHVEDDYFAIEMAAFEEFVHVEHPSALSFEQSAGKLCGVNPVRTRALSITKRLTEPGPLPTSNIFLQNTTRQGVGHRACSLRAIVPHLCHPRLLGRKRSLFSSANRTNPNVVGLDPESSFRKDCPMTMVPIPAVALTPVAYFPETTSLRTWSSAPRTARCWFRHHALQKEL